MRWCNGVWRSSMPSSSGISAPPRGLAEIALRQATYSPGWQPRAQRPGDRQQNDRRGHRAALRNDAGKPWRERYHRNFRNVIRARNPGGLITRSQRRRADRRAKGRQPGIELETKLPSTAPIRPSSSRAVTGGGPCTRPSGRAWIDVQRRQPVHCGAPAVSISTSADRPGSKRGSNAGRVKRHLHRHALPDFGETAGRAVRRQGRPLRLGVRFKTVQWPVNTTPGMASINTRPVAPDAYGSPAPHESSPLPRCLAAASA